MHQLEAENSALDEDSLEEKRVALEDTFEELYTEKSFKAYELDFWRKILQKTKPAEA